MKKRGGSLRDHRGKRVHSWGGGFSRENQKTYYTLGVERLDLWRQQTVSATRGRKGGVYSATKKNRSVHHSIAKRGEEEKAKDPRTRGEKKS